MIRRSAVRAFAVCCLLALLPGLGGCPGSVTVPAVTGLTQAAACAALTAASLQLGAVSQANHATVPAGSVVSQNPAADTSVSAGTAVNLVVSLGPADPYAFDGSMPRAVLEAYLARSITMSDMLLSHLDASFDDNLRMVGNIGAKFLGRAVIVYGTEDDFPALAATLPVKISQVHAIDPDIIVQGALFEFVSRDVDSVPIPAWVFQGLGQPVEMRNFRMDDMVFTCQPAQYWSGAPVEAVVPDLSRPETQRWYYYVVRTYIDAGCEAVHLGMLEWVSECTNNYAETESLLQLLRQYAAQNARRHYVLFDAHTHGIVRNGNLLLDFHAAPLRIKEGASFGQGVLEVGFLDSIYGNSLGGVHPSGWTCASAPYLAEFDHGYGGDTPGTCTKPECVWGYDEVSWFARLTEAQRNQWLAYAWNWVRQNDPNGYVEMVGSRQLEGTAGNNSDWYFANTYNAQAMPYGFNQEDAIKAVWSGQ